MMRNDDIDDIDLSRHRPSRLPGLLVIGAAVGVALIAAWIFTPMLMSKDSAATASLLSPQKARAAAPKDQAAPALAAAEATPAEPAADTAAAADAPASAPVRADAAAAPAAPETTAATPWGAAPAWPQSRSVQVAAAPAAATPPAEDTTRLAAVAPQETPAEAVENVPLPRKRPSRLIDLSLAIPLPRPRPEIEADAPAAGPTTFDLQVERMR